MKRALAKSRGVRGKNIENLFKVSAFLEGEEGLGGGGGRDKAPRSPTLKVLARQIGVHAGL